MSFPHLHNHSDNSLLDGMATTQGMIDWAVENKAPAIALTDHGNLFGAYDFYMKAKKTDVKPIIGCEVYVSPESRHDRDKDQVAPYHLTLLCENNEGYQNLMRLVSWGYLQGFYHKPRIDLDLLGLYSNGLIALTGCIQGQLSQLVHNNKQSEALYYLKKLIDAMPNGNVYVELQNHWITEELETYPELARLSEKHDLPIVGTNDCHYLDKSDHIAHDIMLCIQTKKLVEDEKRLRFDNHFYFKNIDEMREALSDYPSEAIENAFEIADRCNVALDKIDNVSPKYPDLPQEHTESSWLKYKCEEGLIQRYGDKGFTSEMKKRLKYELDMIEKMGYSGYFLVVWDYASYARRKNYPLGARGSAGSSLALHALNVIDFNPMDYNCPFERFLNPDRISMPDIDIDFGDEIRDDVIEYVSQRYGENHVAKVSTFSTLSHKSIIQDAGRVLGIPIQVLKALSKEMDNADQPERVLQKKIRAIDYDDPEKLQKLIPICKKLNKVKRHVSCHASAVIITNQSLLDIVPLFQDKDKQMITQYDGDTLEKLGLIKFDFLASRALMQAHKCIEMVQKYEAGSPAFTLDSIPLDDPETYDLVCAGLLEGIFQLEGSDGIKQTTIEIAPKNFSEFLTIPALYRPGPLQTGVTDQYIKRKHGQETVDYIHPELQEGLKETYGLCIYQEQVMYIAQVLGGFTASEADVLRSAISKKDNDLLGKQQAKFIDGAITNESLDLSVERATDIFKMLEAFGGYGFNKSHTVAYSLLAYRMAYLKRHYSNAFMACVMTKDANNETKMSRYITECRKLAQYLDIELTLLPPHINESDWEFKPHENGIRLGFSCVKNINKSLSNVIIESRKTNGEFKSMADLCDRLPSKIITKKSAENLIKSGAVDGLGEHRAQLVHNIENILGNSKKAQEANETGQIGLFSLIEPEGINISNELEKYPKWDESDAKKYEKQVVGFITGKHPLDLYANQLENYTTTTPENILNCNEGETVIVAGIVSNPRVKKTRQQKPILLFNIEGIIDKVECVFYANKSDRNVKMPEEGQIVLVKGYTKPSGDWNSEAFSIILNTIVALHNIDCLTTDVEVRIPHKYTEDLETLKALQTAIKDNPGGLNVILDMQTDMHESIILQCGDDYKTSGSDVFIKAVSDIFDDNSFISKSNRTHRLELN